MEALISLTIISIAILINIFIASKFSTIAEEKGHDGSTYFWWCFILGMIGYIMVAALPDYHSRKSNTDDKSKNTSTNKSSNVSNNKLDLKSISNKYYAPRGSKANVSSNTWICTDCKRANPGYTGTCACGKSKYYK